MPRPACLWLLLVPCALIAQTPVSPEHAAAGVTAADVVRRIGILSDDSMRGRDTPSPELEKVASWIAEEFRRFGLQPGAGDGTYLQRYPVRRTQLDTSQSFLTVSRGSASPVTLKAGRELSPLQLGQPLPSRDVAGPVVLLTGRADAAADPLAGADVSGAWLAEPASAGSGGLRLDLRAARAAFAAGAVGLLVISDRSDAEWQAQVTGGLRPTVTLGGEVRADTALVPGLVEIRDRAAARVLGIDAAALRAEQPRSARRLGVTLTFRARERVVSETTAPNVIGVLEGSDPALKHEYVLFTAHMDHVGAASSQNPACQARGGDSICNGADDDASGTTAVIENAGAFARLSPRPRRSLVFMTVSGEEKGLWGSGYFTGHPTVPLAAVVADLNADMVGRNWTDTIAVIGKEHSDLGPTLDRVAALHPELRMTPIGDIWPSENFYSRSDHYNFARRGVPILFFFNGTHPDYHQVSDEVSKIDGEKESRIIKLIFYLGLEIANAAERPRWNRDSYRRIVEGAN